MNHLQNNIINYLEQKPYYQITHEYQNQRKQAITKEYSIARKLIHNWLTREQTKIQNLAIEYWNQDLKMYTTDIERFTNQSPTTQQLKFSFRIRTISNDQYGIIVNNLHHFIITPIKLATHIEDPL